MKIEGKTRVLGLIGNPVEHTLSPLIHNTISERLTSSINTAYVPFHVEKGNLESAIKGAFALNVLGMNVTVPYKQEVMEYLVGVDDTAKQIGAVNTLKRCENGFYGYNTDAEGFERTLDFYGIDVSGKKVVMLGAGGASRAVAFALLKKGAGSIHIFNRTIDKAKELSASVNLFAGKEIAFAHEMKDISLLFEGEDYIAVQCTSVGLHPNVDDCVVEDGPFFDHVIAGVDIVYKPSETKFMKNCRLHGKEAYNGLRMLLYQGVAAYEHFTGSVIEDSVCEIVAGCLEKECGITRPIILVGYMGCGKSSVAEELSELLNIPVVDTDAEIVRSQGRSISDIFADDGEEAFRDMETELLEKLCVKGGDYILSVGGGMPLREKNRELLKRIGTVVYLTASAETVFERVKNDTSRPLLSGGDLMDKIKTMLALRGRIYEMAAAVKVETDELSISAVAKKVLELLGRGIK